MINLSKFKFTQNRSFSIGLLFGMVAHYVYSVTGQDFYILVIIGLIGSFINDFVVQKRGDKYL